MVRGAGRATAVVAPALGWWRPPPGPVPRPASSGSCSGANPGISGTGASFRRLACALLSPTDPYEHALLDLRARALETSSLSWWDTFTESMAAGLGATLSPAISADPVFGEVRELASMVSSAVDDIYSFPKERADGDRLNLVAVLMHEHQTLRCFVSRSDHASDRCPVPHARPGMNSRATQTKSLRDSRTSWMTPSDLLDAVRRTLFV